MAADRQRMFFALWPDGGVRETLVAIQQSTPRRRGRATHPLDLHATLVFLGTVDAACRICVEAVADRVEADVFDLHIDQTDFWPRPRIAWCGPTRTPPALQSLVNQLQRGLGDCGFEPDGRPYRPHVTLARNARSAHRGAVAQPLGWHCDRFVLVASTGARQPPRYRVLREWRLGKPTEPVSEPDS